MTEEPKTPEPKAASGTVRFSLQAIEYLRFIQSFRKRKTGRHVSMGEMVEPFLGIIFKDEYEEARRENEPPPPPPGTPSPSKGKGRGNK